MNINIKKQSLTLELSSIYNVGCTWRHYMSRMSATWSYQGHLSSMWGSPHYAPLMAKRDIIDIYMHPFFFNRTMLSIFIIVLLILLLDLSIGSHWWCNKRYPKFLEPPIVVFNIKLSLCFILSNNLGHSSSRCTWNPFRSCFSKHQVWYTW